MKKWLRFFCLSYFSDKISREGAKRGYTNFFLGLILAFAFLWGAYVGGDMLPLGKHYNNSSDFKATMHTLFVSADSETRIYAEIKEGRLCAGKRAGEYSDQLLVNTLESDADKQKYSGNGYSVVVDMRAADALAEIEAYCVSNDGQQLVITYEEYLSLSSVARLNFEFKLRYTGKELVLTDEAVSDYREYLDSLGDAVKLRADKMANELAESKITIDEYNRSVYELYFANYYPDISVYESTSRVPLLRNYYYHEYISQGIDKYIFIFDDCVSASFETDGGTDVSFYGFYSNMEDGAVINDETEHTESVDSFMKQLIRSIAPLTMYAYAMNIFSMIPFIALMPLVVTLLAYSVLKIGGIETVSTFGATFRILGSYVWFSALISAVLTVVASFIVSPKAVSSLPLALFFVALVLRSLMFAVREVKTHKSKKQSEKETVLTEA